MNAIRVIVADDETLLRDALEAILNLQPDIEVVAVASDGVEAIAQITHHKPDVAVLDLQMPGADGIEVTEKVSAASPSTRCMILTSHARPGYLKRSLAAGARSFLPKTTSADGLAKIIRRVHEGQRYVDPELSAEAIAAGDSPLTPREADVLELAAERCTDRGDRGAGAPICGDGAELSVECGDQARCTEPACGRRVRAG